MSMCYLSRKRNHSRWFWTKLSINFRWLASHHKSFLAQYIKSRSEFKTVKMVVFMSKFCVFYHRLVKRLIYWPGKRTEMNQVCLRLANQTLRWMTYLKSRLSKLSPRMRQSVQWSTNKKFKCFKTWDSLRMYPKRLCSSYRVEVCQKLWNG